MPESTFVMRKLGVRWMFLSGLGLVVGVAIGLPLGMPVEASLGMALVTPVVGGVIGTSLGVSQWVLLRRRLARAAWWVMASAAGVAVGLTGGTVLIEFAGLRRGQSLDEALALIVIGGAVGASLGLTQWLVLRGQVVRARWWLLASCAGMAAGFLAGGLAAEALTGSLRSLAGFAVFAVVAGLTAGAATGMALAWIVTPSAGRI